MNKVISLKTKKIKYVCKIDKSHLNLQLYDTMVEISLLR